MKKNRMSFKEFIIIFLVMIVFSAVGTFMIYKTHRDQKMMEDYVSVVGVVVDYNEKFDVNNENEPTYDFLDEDYVYAIIVEYEVDGKFYIAYSDDYSRKPLMIGSVVEVSYDPSKPSIGVINKTADSVNGYFFGGIFLAVGPIVFIIAVVYDLKSKKR